MFEISEQLKDLSDFLEFNCQMSLTELHGFLTAIASDNSVAPEEIGFENIKSSSQSQQQAKIASANIMMLFKNIKKEMSQGRLKLIIDKKYQTYPCKYSHAITSWARGYMFAVENVCSCWDEVSENTYHDLIMPIILLSLDDNDVEKMLEEMDNNYETVSEIKSKCSRELLPVVMNIYFFWKKQSNIDPACKDISLVLFKEFNEKKWGDFCYCGSGYKYQECCLEKRVLH